MPEAQLTEPLEHAAKKGGPEAIAEAVLEFVRDDSRAGEVRVIANAPQPVGGPQ